MSKNDVEINISTKVDAGELETLNSSIKELQDTSVNIEAHINSDADKTIEEFKEIEGTSFDTKDITLESNTEEVLNGLNEINLSDFNYLGSNFQLVADQMVTDAENAAIAIEASMNVVNFDAIVANFQSATDQIVEDAGKVSESVNNSINSTSESANLLSGAIHGIAAFGLADAMFGWADSAGDVNSQFNRLSIALDNVGVGAAKLDSYKTAISEVGSATGRSAGVIREFFISMTNQGIKSEQIISNTFKGIASAAYMMNTDIGSTTSLFTRMITSGALMSRSLAQAGISMDDFAKVMGVSTSEVSNAFKSMSADQRAAVMEMVLNSKYGAEANEGFKNSWDGLKTQLDKAIGGLSRFTGELLLPVFIPATQAATAVIDSLTSGLRALPGPAKSVLGAAVGAAGGLAVLSLGAKAVTSVVPLFTSSIGNIIGLLGRVTGLSKTAATATNAINAAGAASKGGGGFLRWISNINTMAAQAAASTGPAALSWTTLSAGIQTMLAPMLMVAGVIAIMIPIVAGLVIEILAFVRLIGEVVKALRFDKLNLTSAIEGIKQIGLAMWELGRAFAALTLVNMVGLVYNATGGIIGTGLALGQFWLATKGVEAILKDIDKLNINSSVVAKIVMLKEVLNGMSNAMLGMAGLNITGVVTWLTGGVDAVKANVTNIVKIGEAIANMNIPTVDTSKVDLIKKLSEVIKSLSDASQAVDDATGWFNTKVLNQDDVDGMKSTLENLGEIGTAINGASIPTVGKDKVDLVNALANVVKPLAEASKAVDEANGMFQMSVLNQDDVEGMKATLRSLSDIATAINGASIPAVSKDKIDAVRNIENVITPLVNSSKLISDNWQSIVVTPAMALPFSTAIGALYVINQKLNSTAFSVDSSKIQAITNMKTVIQKVAEIGLYLSQNSGNIGSNITSNANALSSSIGSLYVVNQKINSSAFNLAPEKVAAISNLKPFIQRVAEIGLYLSQNSGNLSAIASNQTSLSGAIQSLYSINQQINSMPFQVDEAKTAAINSLKSLIQTIVSTLNAAAGIQPAAQNMGSQITTGFKTGARNLGPSTVTIVAAAIDAVKNRYDTMRSAGNALGAALVAGFRAGSGISSPMAVVVSGLSDTISHINSLSSYFYDAGSALGSSLTAGWSDEQKAKANATDLLRANSGSVMGIFNSSGINWRGGNASAAGGDIIDYKIEYPSNNTYNIHLNGLVTEQSQIDEIGRIIRKAEEQDNMRT